MVKLEPVGPAVTIVVNNQRRLSSEYSNLNMIIREFVVHDIFVVSLSSRKWNIHLSEVTFENISVSYQI